MAGMRNEVRNWLIVLALVGAAVLLHPTATTAAPCENENRKEDRVEDANACTARVRRSGHRQSGPDVFAYGRLGSGTVFADRTHSAPAFVSASAPSSTRCRRPVRPELCPRVRPVRAVNRHHRWVAVQTFGTPLRDARRRQIRLCRRWIELGHRQRWPRSAEWARNRSHELAWRRIAGRADRRLRTRPRQRDPFFAQADATLPFFRAASQTYSVTERGVQSSTDVDYRYVPSAVVSIGVGWHRR